MIEENEELTNKSLELKFNHIPYNDKDKIINKIKKEKNMKAPPITKILENYLKSEGFLIVKEKNYLGYNYSPFDLTAGDENSLRIYGFEIKSDVDTFDKLQKQLQRYSFICEEVYIVLHKKDIPEWLPDWVGVLRVSEENEIYRERYANRKDPFEISTGYAWDIIAKENGVAGSKKELQKLFNEIIDIRKNILFNHYFAITYDSSTNNSTFKRFFPLTDKQKRFICGLNIEYQMKELNKELKTLEKRFTMIKQLMNISEDKKLQ